MASNLERSDYGLDAPDVVRNLYFGAGVGAIILVSRFFGLWNNYSMLAWLFFALMSFGCGCLIAAWGMIWYSRVGKLRTRERLLIH